MKTGVTTEPSPAGNLEVLRFMFDPRYRRDPYPLYDGLRAGGAVQHSALAATLVSSMDAGMEVLRNPNMASNTATADFTYSAGRLGAGFIAEAPFRFVLHRNNAGSPTDRPFALLDRNLLISLDPPDHTRLRALVSRSFTPRVIDRAVPEIERIAHELIDQMERSKRAAPDGERDLLVDFAYALPFQVICSILGVPAEDAEVFHSWVKVLLKGFDIERMGSKALMRDADAATVSMRAYLEGLAGQRRSQPCDDLLSSLVAATDEGDRLSMDELVATVVLLLLAGHETTANLIGNSVWAMHRHPSQRQRFVCDQAIHANAVEELLRFESPIQMVLRVTTRRTNISDVEVPAGRLVVVLLGAANRDPEHFGAPNTLDLDRGGAHPISFGFGAHHCIGASLARAEGRIALGALYERLPRLRPNIAAPRWRSSIVFRGLRSLPVTW